MAFDVEIPGGILADDNFLAVFVPAIADINAPKVAELNATGVIPLSLWVGEGEYNHTVNDEPITANRVGVAQPVQYDGSNEHTLEISYVYTNTAGDKLRLALPYGATGYVVERFGVDREEAFAAVHIVDVIPVRAGRQRKVMPTRNTELKRIQRLNVTGRVATDVTVVAGA